MGTDSKSIERNVQIFESVHGRDDAFGGLLVKKDSSFVWEHTIEYSAPG